MIAYSSFSPIGQVRVDRGAHPGSTSSKPAENK
jgi:hypothetical protein